MEFGDNPGQEGGIAPLNRVSDRFDKPGADVAVLIPHRIAMHGNVTCDRLRKVLIVGHAVPRGFDGDFADLVCVSAITQSTRHNAMINVRDCLTVPGHPR